VILAAVILRTHDINQGVRAIRHPRSLHAPALF
jgi:hypothetical protein